jgi:NAD(P)-dependent dehydrogenase (short-subunit alcohol dehydrogenase family)
MASRRNVAGVEELEGRVAVVTGAASGIGLGIATALAGAGMKVMLADIDERALGVKVQALAEAGHDVASHVVDVGRQEAVEELASATVERFGGVHVVCNNAGIIRRDRTAWQLSADEWHQVIRVNLLGVVHGVRSFVPRLLASGEPGHVVNTGSLASVIAVPGLASYTAAKHAVLGLSEALAAELQAAGAPIGVSVLMPGLVRTRLGLPAGAPDPEGPLVPGQMDPLEVGTHVVAAIREDRLFVFTHPGSAATAAARFARITEAGR